MALNHLQREAELYILEDLRQASSWSRNFEEEGVDKVVELSERQNEQQ